MNDLVDKNSPIQYPRSKLRIVLEEKFWMMPWIVMSLILYKMVTKNGRN